MWGIIAAIITALIGFGTGSVGLNKLLPGQPTSVSTPTGGLCYNPQPNVRLTLTWPDNFVNLQDKRVILNPGTFGSVPSQFNTNEATCRPMIMADTNGITQLSRTYILVRPGLRISSCKTDELAGPFNAQGASCPDGSIAAAFQKRGSCDTEGYTDLRKVAEVNQAGSVSEVFWTPFTHNVGCNYNPNDPNCGIGDRTNINLREFIYVLKRRDAFAPNDPANNCLVLWDAGSTNKQACSHYFDVYMAQDLYGKINTALPETDPDYKTYQFYKSAIENCREESSFTPILDVPGLSYPPQFIFTPFVFQDFSRQQSAKILPRNAAELSNYQYFILLAPAIDPYTTNLLQISISANPINKCATQQAPDLAPPTTCYSILGSIYFEKPANEIVTYEVYSRADTPQTFYFQDVTGADINVYKYTITKDKPADTQQHAPALQLGTLQFSSENEWTWATPWCKPAIYLYPDQTTNLNIKLNLNGKMTISDPPYDTEWGWQVIASPDGKIIPQSPLLPLSPLTYPYLYYEAELTGMTIPEEGWIIERTNIKNKISDIMREIGFNEKEINDFLAYWLPRLTDKPYYFVTLLPEDIINEKERLTFSQNPDSLIRARFVFEGLELPYIPHFPYTPLPPQIPNHERSGFVASDWGGTIVGESCTDLTFN